MSASPTKQQQKKKKKKKSIDTEISFHEKYWQKVVEYLMTVTIIDTPPAELTIGINHELPNLYLPVPKLTPTGLFRWVRGWAFHLRKSTKHAGLEAVLTHSSSLFVSLVLDDATGDWLVDLRTIIMELLIPQLQETLMPYFLEK